jgi:ATP-dependent Zn protease
MATSLYKETITLLEENKDTLARIADRLVEKESIDGDELDAIINGEVLSVSFESEISENSVTE